MASVRADSQIDHGPLRDAKAAVRALLSLVGEDPDREGLADTPARVARYLQEVTSGYSDHAASHLSRQFRCDTDDMVCVRAVSFVSLCEHHLLPFHGTVDLAYIPNGRMVVGLSKLARLVDVYARRLQIQERLGAQIADAMEKHLSSHVAVRIVSTHSCMALRGVKRPGSEMVSTTLRGHFKTNTDLRAEVIRAWG